MARGFITKERIYTQEELLAYILDCNLATVSHMAGMKSRSKCEYTRQISIAQIMLDKMRELHVSVEGTRGEEITGTVAEWAKKYEEPAPAGAPKVRA